MTGKNFINNNTFSGCLHSKGVVQHFHLDLQDNMHLFQPSRWCDMTIPSWALTFPMLGSLQHPKPSLIPSLQVLIVLTSRWHHNLAWVYVDNTPIGPWHFLFAPQLSLSFFLTAYHCCSEWKNSFSELGSNLQRNNSLGFISHWKGCLPCWLTRCGLICPKDMWQLFHQFSLRII